MEKLSFLESTEEVEEPVEAEAQVEETPVEAEVQEEALVDPPKDETPRDEQGRFAPKEDKPVMVPLAALQETRDKLRDLEARLAAQQAPEQAVVIPDVFEDPEGHTGAILQTMQQHLYQERLNMSQRFAVQQFGEDLVAQAKEWGVARCASDPHFNASVFESPDPIGFTVQQFQRDKIASEVTASDYEQFKAWKAAQAQIAQQPAAVVPPPPQSPLPTPSMAAAPSAGGVAHVPTGPGQAYDQIFRN